MSTSSRKWALRTATTEMVLHYKTKVLTAEALIVSKLKAMVNNPARAVREGPDIVSILAKNPRLNHAAVLKHLSSDEKQSYQAFRDSLPS